MSNWKTGENLSEKILLWLSMRLESMFSLKIWHWLDTGER